MSLIECTPGYLEFRSPFASKHYYISNKSATKLFFMQSVDENFQISPSSGQLDIGETRNVELTWKGAAKHPNPATIKIEIYSDMKKRGEEPGKEKNLENYPKDPDEILLMEVRVMLKPTEQTPPPGLPLASAQSTLHGIASIPRDNTTDVGKTMKATTKNDQDKSKLGIGKPGNHGNQHVTYNFGPHSTVNMNYPRFSTSGDGKSLLEVDPRCVDVSCRGGEKDLLLINEDFQRMVFKCKLSNAKDYRISPTVGFVPASGTKTIKLTRTAGSQKEDKLVIVFATCNNTATNAQTTFSSSTPAGSLTIPLSAT